MLDRGVSWDKALAKRAEAAEAGMDPKLKADGTRAPGVRVTVIRSTLHCVTFCSSISTISGKRVALRIYYLHMYTK